MTALGVYLSSTYDDLKEYRDAVFRALERAGLSVARMEGYTASDERPLEKCLRDVARCDLFVGLYAWRYGYEPPADHGNPDGYSITHLEYRQAETSGLRKLLFFAHADTRDCWPALYRDDLTGRGEGAAKVTRFRESVGTEKTCSFFRTADELATLVLAAIMRSGTTGRVYNVPSLPVGIVNRPDLEDAVIAGLVAPDGQPGRHTLIQGAGGFGKTTLALLASHRVELVETYRDGLLWVSLGETPDLARRLGDLHAVVTGAQPSVNGTVEVAAALAKALRGKCCLLVVDDVWREEDIAPFVRLEGPRLLITTRNRMLVQQVAAEPWPEVAVDEMTPDEAVAMLGRGLVIDPDVGAQLRDLAQRLGCWPLLIDLASARLREEQRRGRGTLAQCIAFATTLLERKGILGFDRRDSQARNAAVARSVEVGLELADQLTSAPGLTQRAAELSVLPESVDVPVRMLGELWGLDEFDVEEEVLRPLDQLSLLRWDREHRTIRLHMMIHRALAARLLASPGAVQAAHRRLLDAWGDPRALQHNYAWRWYAWHCVQGGEAARLRGLLLDLSWLRARLAAALQKIDGDRILFVPDVLHDYSLLASDEAVSIVMRALRSSADALREDLQLLNQQLHGRLAGSVNADVAALATAAFSQMQGTAGMLQAAGALEPPGAVIAILRHVHEASKGPIIPLPDGHRVLSFAGASIHLLKITDDIDWIRSTTLPAYIDRIELMADARHVLCCCRADADIVTLWRWCFEVNGEPELVASLPVPESAELTILPGLQRALVQVQSELPTLLDIGHGCTPIELESPILTDDAKCYLAVGPEGRLAALLGADGDSSQQVWMVDLQAGGRPVPLMEYTGFTGHRYDLIDLEVPAFGPRDDCVLWWRREGGAVYRWDGRCLLETQIGARLLLPEYVCWLPGGTDVLFYTLRDRSKQSQPAEQTSGGVEVWHLDKTGELHPIASRDDLPQAMLLAPDGSRAALVGNTCLIIDCPASQVPRVLRTVDVPASNGQWLPDSKRLLVWEAWSADLTLVDTTADSAPRQLDGIEACIEGVVPLPGGQSVLSWSPSGSLQLWNLEAASSPSRPASHRGDVQGAFFCSGGARLLSWSKRGSARVWDLESNEQRSLLPLGSSNEILSVQPLREDGLALVEWVDVLEQRNRVAVFSVPMCNVHQTLDDDVSGPDIEVRYRDEDLIVWCRPDGPSTIGRPCGDGLLALAEPSKGGFWALVREEAMTDVAWLENLDEGGTIYVMTTDGRVLVLLSELLSDGDQTTGVRHGLHELTLADGEVATVAQLGEWSSPWGVYFDNVLVMPAKPHVLSWTNDGSLLIWRHDAPSEPVVVRVPSGRIAGALPMTDGRAITWTSDGRLDLWDVERGASVATWQCEWGAVQHATLVAGQRAVVIASFHRLYLWDLATDQQTGCIHLDDAVTALATHPDGNQVFVGDASGRTQMIRVTL